MSSPPQFLTLKPSATDWEDAYMFCSLDKDNFPNNPDHKQALLKYFEDIEYVDADEEAEIDKLVFKNAKLGAPLKPIKAKVDGFKDSVSAKLPMIKASKCFNGIDSNAFDAGIKALTTALTHLTFSVCMENTQNSGGNITIGVQSLKEFLNSGIGDESVLFALAHEFGHAVEDALRVNDKVPNSGHPVVYAAISPALPTTTTNSHRMEFFADAFAAIFLAKGLGIDCAKIPDATKFMFASEPEGGAHPSGSDRTKLVLETLATKV